MFEVFKLYKNSYFYLSLKILNGSRQVVPSGLYIHFPLISICIYLNQIYNQYWLYLLTHFVFTVCQ